MPEFERQLVLVIAKALTYGGGGAAVAYGLFRFFGSKWIESKFSERLEAYKHAQARELEDVRFRINSLFNRLTKLHDKEFEVLPHAWGKLNASYQAIGRCITSFREFPNLDRFDKDDLEEFLSNTTLRNSEKRMIRESDQKVRTYSDIMSWVEINDAHKAFAEFHSYLVANRIFLHPDLKGKFDEADDLMWKMWVSYKVGKQSGDLRSQLEQFQKYDPEIKRVMTEIEKLIHRRPYPVEPRAESDQVEA